MWEVVFPNIPIEGGIVHPDVHSLCDGPCQAVFFSANDFKVLYRCFMVTATLMYKSGWTIPPSIGILGNTTFHISWTRFYFQSQNWKWIINRKKCTVTPVPSLQVYKFITLI